MTDDLENREQGREEFDQEYDVFNLPTRTEVYRKKKKLEHWNISKLWFRLLFLLLIIMMVILFTHSYWGEWIDNQNLINEPKPYHEEISIE
ncbi:hypothetical protein [Halobacillus seohaensis]|uniref:Uncharacterized protein n=1 Tax=Halobacillus seohaensis TaxID=447421 RepID=A0ABW2EJA8_9BACI